MPAADALHVFVARLATRFFDAPAPRRVRLLRSADASAMRLALALAVRGELLRNVNATPAEQSLEKALRLRLVDALRPENLRLRALDAASPETLLDAVRYHDAVHPVVSEADLRRRLAPDRALYALVHKSRPTAPLAFAEVALTRGLPKAVDRLLDPASPILPPSAADHGVFFGISNTEPGAAGLSLGAVLIERMLGLLVASFPHVTHWVTLSPIPGLRAWLEATLGEPAGRASLEAICTESGVSIAELAAAVDAARRGAARSGELHRGTARSGELHRSPALRAIAEHYLASTDSRGRPVDPVARFHIGNGARVDAVLLDADRSTKGLAQSLGVMASYAYVVGGRRVGEGAEAP